MRKSICSAVLGLTLGAAAVDVKCAKAGVCFGLGIPDATASSSEGDIYFSLKAPASVSWVSLGQGGEMDGANMYIVYPSSDGNNVTISSRLGNGHRAPEFSSDSQLTVLDGSGISNDTLTANVRCSNCQSWEGGSMDFSSSSGEWIWGIKSGEPINSDNPDERISEHDDYGGFSFDFALAKSGQSLNPFIDSEQQFDGAEAAPFAGSGNGISSAILIAHGVMASAAFVVLFPLGAILVRLLHFRTLVWVHAAVQIFSYLVYAAGAGIGIWLAIEIDELSDTHVIIGLVLLGTLFFQPLLGQIHHIMYKKHHKRTVWSYAHIWLGRAAILLGIVNGALGLELADNSATGTIIYSVIAAIAGSVYIAAIVYGEWKRSRAMPSLGQHNRSPQSEDVYAAKDG